MTASKFVTLSVALFLYGCTDASKSANSQRAVPEFHEARLAEVTKRAAQIKVGMTRLEVELIFPNKDGGISPAGASRYYEDPEVKIEVPFDQTGGSREPQNRVNGSVRIYRERVIGD